MLPWTECLTNRRKYLNNGKFIRLTHRSLIQTSQTLVYYATDLLYADSKGEILLDVVMLSSNCLQKDPPS